MGAGYMLSTSSDAEEDARSTGEATTLVSLDTLVLARFSREFCSGITSAARLGLGARRGKDARDAGGGIAECGCS